MRLAILGCRGIPARYGGFESFAEELAAGLAARGHALTVYCQGTGDGAPREHRGARLEHVPSRAGGLHELLYDLRCLWRAGRAHDVVYMLGYGAGAFCWLPKLFGARVWINMDGLEWRRAKWGPAARAWLRLNEGLALRCADLVVFDAEAVARDVSARRGAPPASRVIEYGAEVAAVAADARPLAELGLERAGYWLVVCRIEPENHVLEIVRAFARGASARPLVVVGEPGPGAYARACVEAAGPGVRFVGAVYERARLQALREGCFAYVHGHSVGGTNPSLLEAMAAGTPCLAHDNPFNREVLGEHGAFFGDARDLARAVDELEARTPAAHRAAGARLRALVRERYSWERIVGLYHAELTALAPRGEAGPVREAA